MKVLCRFILKLTGWQLDEQQPTANRYVLIGYPHTSNWDFVLGMLARGAMDVPLNWVAKHSMFWGPFRPLFIAMGGVPINRAKTSGFIQKNIELFLARENFVLGIMPEGTRTKTDRLKTGFYHIANGADVPIALGYLDYKKKKLGVGKVIKTTGNIESDFEIIKDFYGDKTGFNPGKQSKLVINK